MSRPPSTPPQPLARRTARTIVIVVSITGSIIAVCAFAFSFGNIWHLARLWGLPDPIAPLVAPMLDISVVGLLIAVRQLTLHHVPGRHLAGARLLMLACAATTWALNIAQSVLERHWGAAVMDSVAPALLLGWAEVGPTLLRLATVPPPPAERQPARTAPRAARLRLRERSLAPPPGVPRVDPTLADALFEDPPTDHHDVDRSDASRRAA
ncbi:MAG TPA: DUF2637 domain-containing protein [Kineosporiaceae bacterium]